MSTQLRCSLIVFFSLFQSASIATAQQSPDHISVTGKATLQVTPDEMTWSIQVKNEDQNLEKAAENHALAVNMVLDYLKSQKLRDEGIQTSGMKFGQNWSYQDRERVKDGYFASTDISFQVSDLTKYHRVWIGISRLPHVSLTGVHYDHSERIAYRNDARTKALLAAKAKAQTLAQTLGSKIGRPLSIEEVSETYGMRNSNFIASNSITSPSSPTAGNADLAPGQIPITSQVKASFLLITE